MRGSTGITIKRPIEEVYLHSVDVLGTGRSRWKTDRHDAIDVLIFQSGPPASWQCARSAHQDGSGR